MIFARSVFFIVLTLFNVAACWLTKVQITFLEIVIIHAFLFLLFFITEAAQKKVLVSLPTLSLGVNFLRMIICTIFLVITVFKKENIIPTYIYNFLLAYFLYLFHDIFLKKKEIENK